MKTNFRRLKEMPYDKEFDTPDGPQLCHATGLEYFDGVEWWNEYEDRHGNLYYGR